MLSFVCNLILIIPELVFNSICSKNKKRNLFPTIKGSLKNIPNIFASHTCIIQVKYNYIWGLSEGLCVQ